MRRDEEKCFVAWLPLHPQSQFARCAIAELASEQQELYYAAGWPSIKTTNRQYSAGGLTASDQSQVAKRVGRGGAALRTRNAFWTTRLSYICNT
jgi:hypothetical protein